MLRSLSLVSLLGLAVTLTGCCSNYKVQSVDLTLPSPAPTMNLALVDQNGETVLTVPAPLELPEDVWEDDQVTLKHRYRSPDEFDPWVEKLEIKRYGEEQAYSLKYRPAYMHNDRYIAYPSSITQFRVETVVREVPLDEAGTRKRTDELAVHSPLASVSYRWIGDVKVRRLRALSGWTTWYPDGNQKQFEVLVNSVPDPEGNSYLANIRQVTHYQPDGSAKVYQVQDNTIIATEDLQQ